MMHIRVLEFERDVDRVLDLWRTVGGGVRLSPSDSRQELKKKLGRDPDLFLVAEEAGEIVGAVLGGWDGRRGIIYHLAVQQQHRKLGIGRALMDEVEERLRSKGCLKYYLLVAPENDAAVKFYLDMDCEIMDLHIMGKVIS
jgi:ribosomal protein S18 acetylase RimI-like enzyme